MELIHDIPIVVASSFFLKQLDLLAGPQPKRTLNTSPQYYKYLHNRTLISLPIIFDA